MASTDYGSFPGLTPALAGIRCHPVAFDFIKIKFLCEPARTVLGIRHLTSVNISKLCLIKIIWQFQKWHLPLRQKRQTIKA